MTEKIKKLLGDQAADEEQIALAYEMVSQYILNYCGIRELPPGLELTAAAMTADYLRRGSTGAKRVTLGDTAVEYFTAGENQVGLEDYRSQLNRYRRLFAHDTECH